MNSNFRDLAIWIIIALLLVALFNLVQNNPRSSRANEMNYSQFLNEVENRNVRSVTLAGNQISGSLNNGQTFQTIAPNDPQLVERLYSKGAGITVKPASEDVPSLLGVLVNWFPMPLLIAVGSSSCVRCDVGRRARAWLRKIEGEASDREAGPRHV